MRFKQVQTFSLVKNLFCGYEHFNNRLGSKRRF